MLYSVYRYSTALKKEFPILSTHILAAINSVGCNVNILHKQLFNQDSARYNRNRPVIVGYPSGVL